MPAHGSLERRLLELRVPLLPGSTGEIVMPRRALLCAGRITSVPGARSRITDDGARATVAGVDESSIAEAQIVWDIGSADCDSFSYSGLPPFFIEGDANTVEMIERLGM
jgi:hypothetical protein